MATAKEGIVLKHIEWLPGRLSPQTQPTPWARKNKQRGKLYNSALQMVKTESTADVFEFTYLLQWPRLNYQNKPWLRAIGLCLSESDQASVLGLVSNMNNDFHDYSFPFKTGIPVL